MKIVQIDGIRGLITAAFIGVCLFAGFVIFPGYCSMYLWNKYLVNLYMFPELSLFQGVLLWGIIATVYCILSKKELAVSLKTTNELSDDELDSIIRKAKINAKMKMLNKVVSKSDKFEFNKSEVFKSTTVEKDSSNFVSSPISVNKEDSAENTEEETVSNIK